MKKSQNFIIFMSDVLIQKMATLGNVTDFEGVIKLI